MPVPVQSDQKVREKVRKAIKDHHEENKRKNVADHFEYVQLKLITTIKHFPTFLPQTPHVRTV